MSIIGSVSGLFSRPLPSTLETAKTDLSQLTSPATNKIGGLDASSGNLAAQGASAISGTPATSSSSFGSMFDKFVNGVDATMKTAGVEKAKVLTGESTNLHQAMIAMQEAGTAFSLMVEVRNKLVDSYQELMRMQV